MFNIADGNYFYPGLFSKFELIYI